MREVFIRKYIPLVKRITLVWVGEKPDAEMNGDQEPLGGDGRRRK